MTAWGWGDAPNKGDVLQDGPRGLAYQAEHESGQPLIAMSTDKAGDIQPVQGQATMAVNVLKDKERGGHQVPKAPLTLTIAAQQQLVALLQARSDRRGVRVKLRTRGCSGLSYVMEYVDHPDVNEKVLPVTSEYFVCVHPQALLFLVGTEMDFQSSPTRSGFVFRNPNEKGQCGCGSSFHV